MNSRILSQPEAMAHRQAQQGTLLLAPHPLLWGLVLAVVAIDVLLAGILGITVEVDAQARLGLLAIAALAGSSLLLVRRGMHTAATMFATVAFFGLFGYAGALLNYLLMALQRPMIDAWLAAADAWLGFDWMAYFAFFNRHAWLGQLLGVAYQSFYVLFPLTLLGLVLGQRHERLRAFAALYVLTALICVIIGSLFPALGAFSHYQPPAELYANVPLAGPGPYLNHTLALNDGTMTRVALSKLEGIVTFPSFHTVMALMFAWAWRGTRLQWPMFVWSALIILSTPFIGHHYLIDVLGGVAVFLGVLWLLRAWGLTREGTPEQRS